jgi:tetratricopeptide (TPR) repeat protein
VSSSRSFEAAVLAVILAATFLVFRGSLRHPFHFDDSLFLENKEVVDPGNLRSILRPTQIRPLTYLSFFANYRLGGIEARGFHAVNLALHLLNVAAFYLFVRLLVGLRPETQPPGIPLYLPAASAALFALHPVQAEAVNYVYQRSTLIAALFSIAAAILFLLAETRPARRALLAAAAVAFLLAMGGKESAASLPLVLIGAAVFRKGGWSLRSGTARRGGLWFAVLIALSLGIAAWTLHLLARFGERTMGIAVPRIGAGRYLLSEIQIVPRYLRLLVWPTGLSVDHDPTLAPLVSVQAALCLTLLAAIAAGAWMLRRRAPLVTFSTFAFFVLLAPTSSIVPSADLMFEHRLYLPMIAAAPLLALALFYAARAAARREVLALGIAFGLAGAAAAGAGFASRARTALWGDNVRLWAEAVEKAPRKARPHYNLAVALLSQDRPRARAELRRALELRPGHAPSLYNLGWLEQTAGRYEPARKLYEAALAADPFFWKALYNLANLDVIQYRLPEAVEHFRAASRLRPDYWASYLTIATLELELGNPAEACRALEEVQRLRPDLLETHYLRAYARMQQKDFAGMETELRVLEAKDRERAYSQRIAELRRRAVAPADSR